MTKRDAYKLLAEKAADYIAEGRSVRDLAGHERVKVLALADALEVLGYQDEADRVREHGINMPE